MGYLLTRASRVLHVFFIASRLTMSEGRPSKMPRLAGSDAPSAFMARAIELARKAGVEERSGGCFGAVVVQNDKIVGEGFNQVYTTFDPTCHAEISAIRDATRNLKSFELRDCDLYTSNEPCPMCLSACYWARIRKVYYASTVDDAREYGNFDDDIFYEELKKPAEERSLPVECDTCSRESMVSVWKEFRESNKSNGAIHY